MQRHASGWADGARATPGSRHGPARGGISTRTKRQRDNEQYISVGAAGTTPTFTPLKGIYSGGGFDRSRRGRRDHQARLKGVETPIARMDSGSQALRLSTS